MKTLDFRREEGQSLVQVALMLVVLIGFVGLALDGGNLYAERRRMQNAADAGALAGAWAMCQIPLDVDAARALAVDYMEQNGDPDVNPDEDVEIDGYKVTTYASKPTQPFLPFTFGGTVEVPATASAACGAANSACGLWPIAFKTSNWDEIYAGGAGCGKRFAVWSSDKSPDTTCKVDGKPKTKICDCYKCSDSNGAFSIVAGDGRASLDFSGVTSVYTDQYVAPGCGVPEYEDHIRYDSGGKITLPACISGLNGVKAGAKDAFESRIGDNLKIALYDSIGCGTSNCPGGQAYRVTKFGCITVATGGWEKITLEPLPGSDAKKVPSTFVVWATMRCGNECSTNCGSTDGTPPEPNGINAANLVQ